VAAVEFFDDGLEPFDLGVQPGDFGFHRGGLVFTVGHARNIVMAQSKNERFPRAALNNYPEL
jgi:hypothetical protein